MARTWVPTVSMERRDDIIIVAVRFFIGREVSFAEVVGIVTKIPIDID